MKNIHVALSGDGLGTEEVTLNSKGGSLSATLRKGIVNFVDAFQGKKKVYGTSLPFSDGNGLVLLSPFVDDDDPAVQVVRISETRYEIRIEDDRDVDVDEITATFLRLKEAEIAAGAAEFTAPISAQDIRSRTIG